VNTPQAPVTNFDKMHFVEIGTSECVIKCRRWIWWNEAAAVNNFQDLKYQSDYIS